MVVVTVVPEVSFFDEPIAIRVSQLKPWQLITLVSVYSTDEGKQFYSYAFYTADDQGQVDLDKDSSTGGFYTGVEPMGLFWSMWSKDGPGMKKVDIETPDIVQLRVLDGHQDLGRNWEAGSEVPVASLKRYYKDNNTERELVNEGELVGVIFTPKSNEKLSAVLDITGYFGGVLEQRAALLARRRYIVFCLSFFGMKGQPKNQPSVIDLEILDKAIDFLQSKRNIKRGGVGIIGISYGGIIALAAAGCLNRISCGVNISGGLGLPPPACFTYRGKSWRRIKVHSDLFVVYNGLKYQREKYENPDIDDVHIYMPDFHKSATAILTIFGADDQVYEWEKIVEVISAMMEKSGKRNSRIVTYPGAGHVILPPYLPLVDSFILEPGDLRVAMGGNCQQHSEAQVKTWQEILEFFKKNLYAESSSNL